MFSGKPSMSQSTRLQSMAMWACPAHGPALEARMKHWPLPCRLAEVAVSGRCPVTEALGTLPGFPEGSRVHGQGTRGPDPAALPLTQRRAAMPLSEVLDSWLPAAAELSLSSRDKNQCLQRRAPCHTVLLARPQFTHMMRERESFPFESFVVPSIHSSIHPLTHPSTH